MMLPCQRTSRRLCFRTCLVAAGGDSFKHVGLGRDRTSVHVHELIHLLPAALHHQRGTPEAAQLLGRIFDTLQAHPHGELAWIRDVPYDGPLTKQAREWWFEFADELVRQKRKSPCVVGLQPLTHHRSTRTEQTKVLSAPRF
jgi:hypothetical protein